MTRRAKQYVSHKIDQANRRGAKHISAAARRFAGVGADRRTYYIRWTDSGGDEHRETVISQAAYNLRVRRLNACRWVDSVVGGLS